MLVGWNRKSQIGLDEVLVSFLNLICGFDPAQVNETMMETIFQHTPAGTSTNTIIHYAQGNFNEV